MTNAAANDGPEPALPTASILHADLDAFYASVEQRDNPALRGRPVIVGGGVVLAASYEAKRYGVKTAMNERQARELCPVAVVVPPRFEAYSEASRDVFSVFDATSPLVEALSIDEAFIDVTGLRRLVGTPEQIAVQLRAAVRDKVGLAITVGVARTKFLAKVASAVGKPDGLLVVEPHLESEFLHPLPVQALWGVGPVTAEKLRQRGLHTVGEVASLSQSHLVALIGKAGGHHLHALAHHRDPRPVEVGRRRRSIGSQQALGRGRRSEAELTALLHGITDRVTRRLRNASRLCRTVVLRLRFDDFRRATRSRSIQWPTSATGPIRDTAITLLNEALPTIEERGITLIGLSLTNLSEDNGAQLTLPLDDHDVDVEARSRSGTVEVRRRHRAIDETLDDITHRFGAASLTRASLLGKSAGLEMPKLPD